MRALAFGAIAGVLVSAARAPLAQSLFDGAAASAWNAALLRGAALGIVAIAIANSKRVFGEKLPIATALWGAALGFALHALFLSNAIELGGRVALAGALAIAAVALLALGRGAASESATPKLVRTIGLGIAGLGLALSFECVARPLRQLGNSTDDERVFALALLIALAVGASAFGHLIRSLPSSLALATGVAIAAATNVFALQLLASLATRDGLDQFLRTALLGAYRLDLSRRSMLDADLLIAARVFTVPAFVLGAALCATKHRRELASLVGGAALGTFAIPLFANAHGSLSPLELGAFPAERASAAAIIAALGAFIAIVGSSPKTWVAAAISIGAALAAHFAPRPSTLILSPWDRFQPTPTLVIDAPIGRLTVESSIDGGSIATLDRRALTPTGSRWRAEQNELETAWRDAGVAHRDAHVLLIGQLSPERAQMLGLLGAATIDRTAAWWREMPELEGALFGGERPPNGAILSTDEAERQLERDGGHAWDLIFAQPIEDGVFDLPPIATQDRPPIVLWISSASWLADRSLGSMEDWRRDALVAGDGLDELAIGFTDVNAHWDAKQGEKPAIERFGFDAKLARPIGIDWLARRRFEREFAARTAALERLEIGARGSKFEPLARSLHLHFAAQVYSSPYETKSQQVELDPEALDLLRGFAIATKPGLFTRNVCDYFARLLTEKREVELVFSHLEPIAKAWPVWPALERALAAAELETLNPRGAADHWLRVIEAEPLALDGYAPCAIALLAADDAKRAVEILDRALAVQPARKDWERLRAIALVRSNDPNGRAEVQRLLLADPDDAELKKYLGDGPWPPYQPPSAAPAHEFGH